MSVRSLVRGIALAATLVAAAWAVAVVLTGGFAVTVSGRLISSREVMRPLYWGSAALALFVWANGAATTARAWSRWTARIDHRVAAALLVGCTTVVGFAYASTVANASDSYGYVSEADLWLRGDLVVSQPWAAAAPWPDAPSTLAPLGYRLKEPGNGTDLVPVYSPGLPLLMAAAKKIGGQRGLFAVLPVAGAILVLATWGIGHRLGSSAAGLIAAWFVMSSPVFLFMLMLPMTDVPVAACWAVMFYCLLRPGAVSGAAAGAAAGLAILIRPNLAWLAFAPIVWLLWQARRPSDDRARPSIARLLGFVAGVAAALVAVGIIFTRLYGSPFRSGYGDVSALFSAANIVPNLRNYGNWLIASQTPLALAGLAAIAWPARRLWPEARDRNVFWVIGASVAGVWLFYCWYMPFDAWWYLRFLLASWPFIMLGLAAVLLAVARSGSLGFVVVTWLVVVLGVRSINDGRARGAFDVWRADRVSVAAAQATRAVVPPSGVVLAGLHSGSLRYYGGRVTLRFDLLDGAWLDRAVTWMVDHGASSYALLNREEVGAFKARFAGQDLASRLDDPPVLVFSDRGLALYALSTQFAGRTQAVVADLSRLRCTPPAELPSFAFR